MLNSFLDSIALHKREILHSQEVDTNPIRRAANVFRWEKSYEKLNICEIVYDKTVGINSISYFCIFHETAVCSERDSPLISNKSNNLIQGNIYKYR